MPKLSPALLEMGLTSPLRQLDEATQVTDSNVKWPPHERGFSPLRPPATPSPHHQDLARPFSQSCLRHEAAAPCWWSCRWLAAEKLAPCLQTGPTRAVRLSDMTITAIRSRGSAAVDRYRPGGRSSGVALLKRPRLSTHALPGSLSGGRAGMGGGLIKPRPLLATRAFWGRFRVG